MVPGERKRERKRGVFVSDDVSARYGALLAVVYLHMVMMMEVGFDFLNIYFFCSGGTSRLFNSGIGRDSFGGILREGSKAYVTPPGLIIHIVMPCICDGYTCPCQDTQMQRK